MTDELEPVLAQRDECPRCARPVAVVLSTSRELLMLVGVLDRVTRDGDPAPRQSDEATLSRGAEAVGERVKVCLETAHPSPRRRREGR